MLSRETKSMPVSEYLYSNIRTLFLAPRSHNDLINSFCFLLFLEDLLLYIQF
ncbi:hypothetical protein IC582_002986 [Cucumis melo]